MAELFNDYFVNIVETATGVPPKNMKDDLPQNMANCDIVDYIIDHYKDHPSVTKINQHFELSEKFSLKEVSQGDIHNHLKKVNTKKSTGDDKIPPKILKISADVIDAPLTIVINSSISEMNFPEKSKRAAVAPIF